MTQYNGVLLRQNLEDQGILPRTGGWTASPDIIAAGDQPVENPQSVFGSAASYKTGPAQPVVINAANYIYLRGKNLGAAAQDCEARVFWAPSSLFLYPSQWEDNAIETARGEAVSKIATLAPNAIGVMTDPFVWIKPDHSEHTCLVGFLSTKEYPFASQKPPNAVTKLQELATWIGKNGGTGWHNVQFTSTGQPTFTKTTTYPASTTPARVRFSIYTNECPDGSTVSFSCGTPLPDGKYINLTPQTVKQSPIGFYKDYDVPAGWTSPITYSYNSNGKPPLGDKFKVAMSAAIVKDGTEDSDLFADYTRDAREVHPNHIHVGADGELTSVDDMPVNHLIPCGSDITRLPTKI